MSILPVMKPLNRPGLARVAAPMALAASALLASPAALAGPKIWISLGEDAYQLLQTQRAPIDQVEVHPMTVLAPQGNGVAPSEQRVMLARVDADALPALSTAVHHELHRCGGYVVHASAEAGRQALARTRALAWSPDGLLKAEATVPSYKINDSKKVNQLLPLVQEARILSAIEQLSAYRNRYYTTSHGVAASNDLAASWQALAAGRSDVTVEQFTHAAWPQKSVILTIRGSKAPDELVVIGGHLDSTVGFTGENTRAPGADDDASGIASLQEVMRVLLESGYKPKRSLQFIAYAAEEVGLRGSSAIANSYRVQGKNVVGALQLDMTNYQGSSSDVVLITDYTNAAQNDFLQALATAYLPTLTVTRSTCGYACSDHASWTTNGFASSFPFEAPMSLSNPHIHTAGDTLDKSGNSAAHALKFTRLALTYAVELGSDTSR